jgi:hypothetical protein
LDALRDNSSPPEQDADFRQIQGNFDIHWYDFTPQYGMVEGENVPWFIPISKTTRYRGTHASSQRAKIKSRCEEATGGFSASVNPFTALKMQI